MMKRYSKPSTEIIVTELSSTILESSRIPINGKGNFDAREEKDWNLWEENETVDED